MAKKASPQKGAAKGDKQVSEKLVLFRLFDSDHKWDDKDEVLDAVYWSRQVLAFFMGLIWGFVGLTGFLGIALFGILNSIAAFAIANKTGYDFEDDEHYLSVKEGFMTTFATFLVTWIVTYTAVHFGN